MTDSPATSNQKNRDASASNCETINQASMGVREGVFFFQVCAPEI
jgi:hypothetical protein